MIDGIRVAFPRKFRLYLRLLERRGFRRNSRTHEVFYPDGQTTHMFVEQEYVYGVGTCVVLRGSLHKFYRGNNEDIFTHRQVKKAINKLMKYFAIPRDAKLIRVEVGFNIEAEHPEEICNDAIMINGRFRNDLRQIFEEPNWHSAEWDYVEKKGRINYIIKLYKKTDKIIRYEIQAHHIDSIFPFLDKLIDLLREEKFIACQDTAFRRLKKMDFVPLSFVRSLPDAEMRSQLQLYRESFIWEEYKNQSRSKKCRERKKLNRILYKQGAQNWRDDLLQGISKVAALMLDIRPVATNSHQRNLGLQWESVAATASGCNATDTANVRDEALSLRTHTPCNEPRGAERYSTGPALPLADSASTAHTPAAAPSARGPPTWLSGSLFALRPTCLRWNTHRTW